MLKSFTNKVLQIKGSDLRVPIAGNPYFNLKDNITVDDISAKLQSASGCSVSLKLLDGVEITKSTPASELLNRIFVLEVGSSSFKVFPPTTQTKSEKFHEFVLKADIPTVEAQTLFQFLSQLEKKFEIQATFTKEEVKDIVERQIPRGTLKYKTEDEMLAQLIEYEAEIATLEPIDSKIQRKSVRFANMVLSMGLATLMSQWTFVATGTYVFFSWDIMEPITYCMSLTNMCVALGFYTYRNQEFVLASVFDSLIDRKRRQLYGRLGIEPERLEYLLIETKGLRTELYALP